MKIKITTILILFCTVSTLYAQSALSTVKWITSSGVTISTNPNTYLYRIYEESSSIDSVMLAINNKNLARSVINTENYKTKRFRKPTTFRLLGLQNQIKHLHFDTYLVEYNDDLYLLSKEYVKDNSYLDNVNKELDITLSRSQTKVDSLSNLYARNQNLIKDKYNEIYSNKIDSCYQLKENLTSSFSLDSIENQAKIDFAYKKQQEFDDWYNKQSESVKIASKKIIRRREELTSPNSAGGCDFLLTYTNTSKKVIKYLNWSGRVYNAVGDMVQCDIRDSSYMSGYDTGPVNPDDDSWCGWDCIIYNWSAETLKLSSIDIQYIDGSRTSIKGNVLNDLIKASDNLYSTAPSFKFENSAEFTYVRDVKKAYESKHRKELSQTNNEIEVWREKLSKLKYKTFAFLWSDTPEDLIEKTNELISLQKELSTATSVLEDFKTKNLMK